MAVNSYREDEFMENTDKKKIMRRLFSYLLAYKGTIIAVLVCMGITVAISLVNPLLIEEAIDHYIAQSDLHGLIGLGIFALVLNLIFIVMVKLRMYAMAVISNKILLQIRQDLYEHIQTLSFSFFDSRPTGKILARIIGDVNSLKDVLVNVVTNDGAGICDGSRGCRDHAGKRLAACACITLYDPAYDRGDLVCTDGIPQTLADIPEKGIKLKCLCA